MRERNRRRTSAEAAADMGLGRLVMEANSTWKLLAARWTLLATQSTPYVLIARYITTFLCKDARVWVRPRPLASADVAD